MGGELLYNRQNTIRFVLRTAEGAPIEGVSPDDTGFEVYLCKAGQTIPYEKELTNANFHDLSGGICELTLSPSDCDTPGRLVGWATHPLAVTYQFEYYVTPRGLADGVQAKTYSLKDSQNQPIVGATVKIAMVIDSGVTNENGEVTFAVPNGAEFYLVSSHPNYTFPGVDVEVT